MAVQQHDVRNLLLRRLDAADFARLADQLEPVDLVMREQILVAGASIKHAYFLETAVASIIVASESGRRAEVALTGREGMVDVAQINGIDRSPLEALTQIPGTALRLSATVLREAMTASASLRGTMLRYAQFVVVQVSSTALVNITHTLEQRLARWLLMTHDRIIGDEIPMTHQFLSLMLGVRRAGVTMTVHKLESAGVVRSRRGLMIVADRAGLETIARDAYGLPEAEYGRLVGPDIRRSVRRSPSTGSGSDSATDYASVESRA